MGTDSRRGRRGAGRTRSKRAPGRSPGRSKRPDGGGRRVRTGGLPGTQVEGTVGTILSTSSQAQILSVEDDRGGRWQVECLGEAVAEGARIRFAPVASTEGRQGVLVRVLEDHRASYVCTLRRIGRALVPIPFGAVELPPLELAEGDARGAQEGDRVLVVALAGPQREGGRPSGRPPGRGRKRARGAVGRSAPRAHGGRTLSVRITRVLGRAGEPDADAAALAWKYRLPTSFTRRARIEADALPAELAGAELARRLDLRHLPFVTIDPAGARDHDDALYAEAWSGRTLELVRAGAAIPSRPALDRESSRRPGPVERLWVAIADVAHFVDEGGFIDAEARRRGNSFYFPDRALPMLPERLSSELCSLLPGEDRLVLAVELLLAADGELVDASFHEAVIRVRAKLSYEAAAGLLAAQAESLGPAADEPDWKPSLSRLAGIAERLGAHRRRAGSIELDLPEVEIEVDDTGRPLDAKLRRRNPAHGLVEEAMLAANRTVAAALERARLESIHRVHPPPDPRRLDALGALLARFGFEASDPLESPGAIAAMLAAIRGTPSEERIHRATLRSMSQARYEARSGGHYALQFPHYLHFTSPIRRYADLCVHRALKRWLSSGEGRPPQVETARKSRSGARRSRADQQDARSVDHARLAAWLSGRERVAVEAEREAAAFACCALLADREGGIFAAEVTGIGEHGLFVRLERPAAEGLVPIRTLGSRWRIDPDAEVCEADSGAGSIEVGSAVVVRLAEVDSDRGRLAFVLVKAGRPHRASRTDQGTEIDSESDAHSA